MPFNKARETRQLENRKYTVAEDYDETVMKELVAITTDSGAHVVCGGRPLRISLAQGAQSTTKETFTLQTQHLWDDEYRPMVLCFFSYVYEGVTYYITAQEDKQVVLQPYALEPKVDPLDGRLFLIQVSASSCSSYKFRKFGTKDVFLSYDEKTLFLKTMDTTDLASFSFHLTLIPEP